MSTSYLVALPIDILELTPPCLSGQDVIKIQAVWSIRDDSRRIVDFVSRSTGSFETSFVHRPPYSTRAIFLPSVWSIIPTLLLAWLSVENYARDVRTSGPIRQRS